MTTNDSSNDRGWTPSRRTALKGGLAAAALASVHSVAQGLPFAADPPDYRRWLIERTTFGWTPAMDTELCNRGWRRFLEWQFRHNLISDTVAVSLADERTPSWDMLVPETLSTLSDAPPWNFEWAPAHGSALPVLMGWKSQKQLLWVMTDFWTNFFNRFLGQEYQQVYWQHYQREVLFDGVTGNALGNFPDLLEASAKGASMLLYLNLFQNSAGDVNENYARELLELHTVGLEPEFPELAFTEDDVVAAANILTGWRSGQFTGVFEFDPNAYAGVSATVLGQPFSPTHPGQLQGEQLLAFLAGRKSTAKHVATRLCEWFIGDDCPAAIVTKVQDSFETSGGHIPTVLVSLFEPATFALVGACKNYRRPLNLVTAFFRATDPEFDIPYDTNHTFKPDTGVAVINPQSSLLDQLEALGQRPGYKPSPDGFPGDNEPWLGALQPRLDFTNSLAHLNTLEMKLTDAQITALFSGATYTGYAQHVSDLVSGGLMDAGEVALIQAQIDDWKVNDGLGDIELGRETLSLIFSAPSMQFLA